MQAIQRGSTERAKLKAKKAVRRGEEQADREGAAGVLLEAMTPEQAGAEIERILRERCGVTLAAPRLDDR